MADSPFTGLTAKLTVGSAPGTVLGYVSGVDLNLEKDIIEIIQFGAQYKEKIPAIKNWTASIDGTLAIAPTGSQKDLYDAFESGDPVTVNIYMDDDTYFSGSAFVKSFGISAAPDDSIKLKADLEGSGSVTLTQPTGTGGGGGET